MTPGAPLGDLIPLQDVVLDLEITGNRPDLLSVYGIAREVAALFRLDLAPPPGRDPEPVGDEPVDVTIEDFEGCPRYIGRLFRDVTIGASPLWLRARLDAAGMRPISNVVDVTNYVMLGLGNPLHAFDQRTLSGGRIVVRRARVGEKLTTLDGVERELDPSDLMIADAERSVALAGIMGGAETEISEGTTEVLLEAANFEPDRPLANLRAASAAHRGLQPLGKRRRSLPRGAGGRVGDRAPRRTHGCTLRRAHGRAGRASGAPGRPLPPGARQCVHRARRRGRGAG